MNYDPSQTGPGSLEKPQAERLTGADQEGGGEEEDGEEDEGGGHGRPQEEEHQDLPGDRRGEVRSEEGEQDRERMCHAAHQIDTKSCFLVIPSIVF